MWTAVATLCFMYERDQAMCYEHMGQDYMLFLSQFSLKVWGWCLMAKKRSWKKINQFQSCPFFLSALARLDYDKELEQANILKKRSCIDSTGMLLIDVHLMCKILLPVDQRKGTWGMGTCKRVMGTHLPVHLNHCSSRPLLQCDRTILINY